MDDRTVTPAPQPFGCAGFVAYLRGGNLSLDDAEMLARKFEAADAELARLRARLAELEEQVAGAADDMRAAEDRSDSR